MFAISKKPCRKVSQRGGSKNHNRHDSGEWSIGNFRITQWVAFNNSFPGERPPTVLKITNGLRVKNHIFIAMIVGAATHSWVVHYLCHSLTHFSPLEKCVAIPTLERPDKITLENLILISQYKIPFAVTCFKKIPFCCDVFHLERHLVNPVESAIQGRTLSQRLKHKKCSNDWKFHSHQQHQKVWWRDFAGTSSKMGMSSLKRSNFVRI